MTRFQAIACDYDSTLAHEGRVAPETLKALRRARQAGRKLILITGRTWEELQAVFSESSVFDLVVVENGALLFDPSTGMEEGLCAAAPEEFTAELAKRHVPFSTGKRVIATHRPYDTTIERVIGELNLKLAITFNRESVMVLPRGVDKASGLKTALNRLRIRVSEVVGIGDAENDFAFLRLCGFSVAVANAIKSLKQEVDYVTQGADGAGVSEIIEQVIAGGPLVEARD